MINPLSQPMIEAQPANLPPANLPPPVQVDDWERPSRAGFTMTYKVIIKQGGLPPERCDRGMERDNERDSFSMHRSL